MDRNQNIHLVGRIDLLDYDKNVTESIEYSDEKSFIENIYDNINSGLPMIVVLYSDKNGKTILDNFKYDLIPFQQGLHIEDMNGEKLKENEPLPFLYNLLLNAYKRKEQSIENSENIKLIGRIDFLDFHKKVAGNTEYSDEKLFIEDINDCIDSCVPMTVVLYSDENGKTISDNFKYDLIPFRQGLHIEDSPVKEKDSCISL